MPRRTDPYRGRSEPREVTINRNAGHTKAQRKYRDLGLCEVCGLVDATERHHKDKDTHNNERSNLTFVCRPCHMQIHDTAAVLAARNPILAASQRKDPVPCVSCGRLAKPTRRGMCHSCYERRRRRGLLDAKKG